MLYQTRRKQLFTYFFSRNSSNVGIGQYVQASFIPIQMFSII